MRYTIGYHQEEYKQKTPQVIINNPKKDKPRIIDKLEKLEPLPIKKDDEDLARKYLKEIEKDIYGVRVKRKEITSLLNTIPKIINDLERIREDYEQLKEMYPDLSSIQQHVIEKGYKEKIRDEKKRLNNTIKEINTKLTEIGG